MNQHCFRHIVVMGVSGSGKTTVGEALSPLVVVSSRFALAFVPAALVFHLGIALVIGYSFPSLPLLLLLLPWDAIGRRLDPPA